MEAASSGMMTLTTCPLCGAGRFSPFLRGKDRLSPDQPLFTVVRCEPCGFCFTNPRPTPETLSRHYPSSYAPWRKGRGLSKYLYPVYFRLTRPWGVKPGQKILDIGCGSGHYAAFVAGCGAEAFGCDIGPKPENTEVAFFRGTVREASYPDEAFDRIILWHVLEHLHDFRETLLEVRRILKRDGQVLLGMPNIKGMEIRFFRSKSHLLQLPRHLSHFSPETLARLLSECGFEILERRSDWLTPGPWIRSGFYLLEDLLRIRFPDPLLEKIAILGFPISACLNFLSNLFGSGNLLLWKVQKAA